MFPVCSNAHLDCTEMMSMSYQLEILCYQVNTYISLQGYLLIILLQAQRMRSLGWADFLKVEMRDRRKTLAVSYWMSGLPLHCLFSSYSYPPRRPPQPAAPGAAPNRIKLPPHGGTLTISIVEKPITKTARSPIARTISELQRSSKLGDMRPSDEVDSLQFDVKWEPMKGVLATDIDAEEAKAAVEQLVVVRQYIRARGYY